MKRLGVICAVGLLALLVGCGETGENVSRSDLGNAWPLTVKSGTIRCDGSEGFGAVVFTDPDGNEYGVNGTAKSQGYAPIDPIWRDDHSLDEYLDPGAVYKIDISPLIKRGLKLCS